jgi:hypothetical protein
MPALPVAPVGGDAVGTNFTCSRSPSAAWSPALRRRNPSAARSLLRNPPLRSSLTCGASSGRRLMAPASLHNNREAARGTRERWSSTPDAWAGRWSRQPVPGRYRRSTATPTTACRKPEQCRPTTRYCPCLLPRSRSNLQHHPDGSPVDVVQLALCLRNWPSGARAGTPDRRGKRGEVAAIFAMITTNPTRSIGELGLGITPSRLPPSC